MLIRLWGKLLFDTPLTGNKIGSGLWENNAASIKVKHMHIFFDMVMIFLRISPTEIFKPLSKDVCKVIFIV